MSGCGRVSIVAAGRVGCVGEFQRVSMEGGGELDRSMEGGGGELGESRGGCPTGGGGRRVGCTVWGSLSLIREAASAWSIRRRWWCPRRCSKLGPMCFGFIFDEPRK